ncbi:MULTISPECIES: DUF4267 domain-containing protein [unclassified Streptomyces]|uniref:DUF4267 domain-containing protein n=1 Tax=unclassified Streptomyces TaxID=2593676 RepID=UPI0007EDA4F4|nr:MULTISPECIES: DUF4267 domain-containing protein [unclassified Streptomyces]MCP3767709.1 DUF4267 domain-containing protein [Streptomyces sp. MAR25Y5]OBQ53406.1 hypothetical protein A4U61_04225 [Streptomyces sp. H-KF8]
MLTDVATVLAGLIGAGIIFMGARAFWAPQAAVGFGIPDTPTEDRTFQAWLAVKAVRDMASGLFIFVLLVGGSSHLLGWFMLAATVIPVGDALIVLRSNGPKAAAYGIHGATAAVMLVISVLLLIG